MTERRNARVLVVDDDDDIREIVVELLEANGFLVEGATNGREALDRLTSSAPRPEVIVLDLLMPVMDGPSFRRAQLADADLARIPVVVVSANARVDETAAAMGVDAWLQKPFDAGKLLEYLRAAVGSKATP